MVRRRSVLAALAALLALVPLLDSGPAFAAPGAPGTPARPDAPTARGRQEVSDDELLVAFKPGAPAAAEAAAHSRAGGQVVREIPGLDVKVVRVPRGRAQERLAVYQANPNVEYAEANGIVYAAGSPSPSDPMFTDQSLWGVRNTGQVVNGVAGTPGADSRAAKAWAVSTGPTAAVTGPERRIAILDSGIRESHPDLAGKVTDRRNWTLWSTIDDVDDRFGHGTHVAGTAAAVSNNGTGIAGVCQDCELINGKILGDDGTGRYDWMANGILWAVGCDWRDRAGNCLGAVRAKTINLSVVGTFNSRTLRDAIDKAWSRGAVIACAAGNDNVTTPYYPAGYGNCIAVAATDNRDQRASFSNYGSRWVDVAAPGVQIVSTLPTDNSYWNSPTGYSFWNGTSMATPHVAGTLGLIWSKNVGKTNTTIRSLLESNADRIAGTRTAWSKGRINACRALAGTAC